MKYTDYRKERQNRYNAWFDKYGFYAFSDEQFKEGMKRFSLGTDDNSLSKIYRGPAGLFYLKEGTFVKNSLNSSPPSGNP